MAIIRCDFIVLEGVKSILANAIDTLVDKFNFELERNVV